MMQQKLKPNQNQKQKRCLSKAEEHGLIILSVIKKRISYHETNYAQILSEVTSECDKLKKEIDAMCAKMQQQLKRAYATESQRLTDLQTELSNELQNRRLSDTDLETLIQHTKNNLKTKVAYEFKKPQTPSDVTFAEYAVKAHMSVSPNMWVPTDVQAVVLPCGDIRVTWSLEESQQRALLTGKMSEVIQFKVEFRESGTKIPSNGIMTRGCACTLPCSLFYSGSKYHVRVRMEHKTLYSDWSPLATVKVPEFPSMCAWRPCAEASVDPSRQYTLSGVCGEIATKTGDYCHSTVVGKAAFPRGRVTSYDIKIVNSRNGDCASMWVGVAPCTIDGDAGNANLERCGWYLNCYGGYLASGPPQRYSHKEYARVVLGGKFREGRFVGIKGGIGVAFDSVKGCLGFERKGKWLGVAFEGIPLDVPIVPVVLFYYEGDSVEISQRTVY